MKSSLRASFLISSLLLFAAIVATARYQLTGGCMYSRSGPVCGKVALVPPLIFWVAALVSFGISLAKLGERND